MVASGWYGVWVPAATPRPIVERLQAEFLRALADPGIKQKLVNAGLEARGLPGTEFSKFLDDETRKWTDVIRKAGIKGE